MKTRADKIAVVIGTLFSIFIGYLSFTADVKAQYPTAPVAGAQAPTPGAQPYPAGSLPVTITASGTTGSVVATLPAISTRTTFICGFEADAMATSIAVVNLSVAGTISGTLPFFQNVNPQATAGVAQMNRTFTPCIPASAINTPIVVTGGPPGAGGNQIVTAWGFQL